MTPRKRANSRRNSRDVDATLIRRPIRNSSRAALFAYGLFVNKTFPPLAATGYSAGHHVALQPQLQVFPLACTARPTRIVTHPERNALLHSRMDQCTPGWNAARWCKLPPVRSAATDLMNAMPAHT
jgi:hypothetical protein